MLTLVASPHASTSLAQTIDTIWEKALVQLGSFEQSPDFVADVRLAFGDDFDIVGARQFIIELVGGNRSLLPQVKVLEGTLINGAYGAYAAQSRTIYLSHEFLLQYENNLPVLTSVLLEEFGHYLDAQFNPYDAIGDEGERFASLVEGDELSDSQIQALRDEEDRVAVEIAGQTVLIEQATTIFTNVFNPVGITIDASGNIFIDNGAAIGKFEPDGDFLGQNFSSGFGYLATMPSAGRILKLTDGGGLFQIDPNTLNSFPLLNIKLLNNINTNSIYDIATGRTSNFGGLVLPNAVQTQYGDISILERGNQIDLFISGISIVTPFVMRLRFQNNVSAQTLTDARVVIASIGTTAGTSNLNRGVAVNRQGTVLTTLPIAVGGFIPTFID